MNDELKNLGFIYDVCAGFQFDLNSVIKKTGSTFTEGHLCDHNCTTQFGNYLCPAAFSQNKGVLSSSQIPLKEVIKSLKNAHAGLINMNTIFLSEIYDKYLHDYNIPKTKAVFIKQLLEQNKVELNLFGGNPELHPNFLQIIKVAKQTGWRVTATTTGKKFMFDKKFTDKFLTCPADLLAFSADDYHSIGELNEILDMSLEDLKTNWLKTNLLYGQKKKALESIYSTKFFQDENHFCPVLFNIVIHPGNIKFIDLLIKLLHDKFPKVILNPYPAQSSFSFSSVKWSEDNLSNLEKFIDSMIVIQKKQSVDTKKTFVPRLPYWLSLKSIFLTIKKKKEILKFMTGNGTWRCYQKKGAGRYLQASSSEFSNSKTFKPGGHLGCFWNNNTITDSTKHIWELNPEKVSNHILEDKLSLSELAKKPCPGCLMPRLMFDGISTELGLNETLLPAYLVLRKKYFGF